MVLKALRPLNRSLSTSAQPISCLYSNFKQPNLDETQLNRTLHSLVTKGQFSAAERLRLKIVSNGLYVYPQAEYAHVALACLRNRRLTGALGFKLHEYLTWLELVPDRERIQPSWNSISKTKKIVSPFDSIVHEITYRAPIPKFRPFLSQTGLIVASKGFAKRHFLNLARPIIINSLPTSPCLTALIQMEQRATNYEHLHQLPQSEIAKFIRCSLIQLFVQRGWLWKSVDLVLTERNYPLPDAIYQLVLEGIGYTRQMHKKSLIVKRWDKDKALVLHGVKN